MKDWQKENDMKQKQIKMKLNQGREKNLDRD
jgi:hypothetical protein